MRAIILAAGSGGRFQPVTGDIPKCLLEINGQKILNRLICQITSSGISDINIVVGYKKGLIINKISKVDNCNITIVENEKYIEDLNILSLTLALKKSLEPFYLFEGDCVFEDKCFKLIFNPTYEDKSIWYSMGDFTPEMHGGIIKANQYNEVTDVQIVKAYEDKYKGYKKMIGVLKIGEDQLDTYTDYLFKACSANIKQYYHMPWIEHIDELESYLCDMGHLKLASFNTVEAYYKTKEIFQNETC